MAELEATTINGTLNISSYLRMNYTINNTQKYYKLTKEDIFALKNRSFNFYENSITIDKIFSRIEWIDDKKLKKIKITKNQNRQTDINFIIQNKNNERKIIWIRPVCDIGDDDISANRLPNLSETEKTEIPIRLTCDSENKNTYRIYSDINDYSDSNDYGLWFLEEGLPKDSDKLSVVHELKHIFFAYSKISLDNMVNLNDTRNNAIPLDIYGYKTITEINPETGKEETSTSMQYIIKFDIDIPNTKSNQIYFQLNEEYGKIENIENVNVQVSSREVSDTAKYHGNSLRYYIGGEEKKCKVSSEPLSGTGQMIYIDNAFNSYSELGLNSEYLPPARSRKWKIYLYTSS